MMGIVVKKSWRLQDSEHFCLALSLNRSPEEVIEIYGADAGRARWLLAKDTPLAPHLGSSLRTGELGKWSFCIEFENFIGSEDKIMRDLSAQTESIVIFRTAKALTAFHYAVNGQIVEWFEPGYLSSLRGQSSYEFAHKVHALTAANVDPVAACLQVIAGRIGHELTTEILHGPLLTAVIDEPDLAALRHPDPPLLYPEVPQENSRRRGRRLGRRL